MGVNPSPRAQQLWVVQKVFGLELKAGMTTSEAEEVDFIYYVAVEVLFEGVCQSTAKATLTGSHV